MAVTGILSKANVTLVDYICVAEKSVTPAAAGGKAFAHAAISASFAERVKAGAQFLLLLDTAVGKLL